MLHVLISDVKGRSHHHCQSLSVVGTARIMRRCYEVAIPNPKTYHNLRRLRA